MHPVTLLELPPLSSSPGTDVLPDIVHPYQQPRLFPIDLQSVPLPIAVGTIALPPQRLGRGAASSASGRRSASAPAVSRKRGLDSSKSHSERESSRSPSPPRTPVSDCSDCDPDDLGALEHNQTGSDDHADDDADDDGDASTDLPGPTGEHHPVESAGAAMPRPKRAYGMDRAADQVRTWDEQFDAILSTTVCSLGLWTNECVSCAAPFNNDPKVALTSRHRCNDCGQMDLCDTCHQVVHHKRNISCRWSSLDVSTGVFVPRDVCTPVQLEVHYHALSGCACRIQRWGEAKQVIVVLVRSGRDGSDPVGMILWRRPDMLWVHTRTTTHLGDAGCLLVCVCPGGCSAVRHVYDN